MIRRLATAAAVGGLLKYVFGKDGTKRKAQSAKGSRKRKPARRARRASKA